MSRARRTFIIAEAGVNHNGSLAVAKRLVDAAKKAGADAIKFQTFRSRALVTRTADKARYQKKGRPGRESQYEMLKKLELSESAHRVLLRRCRTKNITFLSSAFDLASIDFLNALGLKIFKIPSGEITNLPYLRKIGALKKPVILSTGMADLGEVRAAFNALIESGAPKDKIMLLHCTTEYPAPFRDVNLAAIETLRAAFRVPVGYSDHTPGIEVSLAAVALGASVIEKHFTLDKALAGPDHRASLEPGELKALVTAVRNIEAALGDGIKKPAPSEKKNLPAARKSIVAAKAIKKGEFFTADNITTKRPGNGLSPMLWDAVIGTPASMDYAEDDLIVR